VEMNQIRYFVALGQTLNFTRAAEQCNVTQPALTRAIHMLEAELGGELLRRERSLSHLTELGERMMPFMRQCHESAIAAKSLAKAVKKGDTAPLSIALSQTVNVALLSPKLRELSRAFTGLRLKLWRGSGPEVVAAFKSGDVELAVAGPLDATWDRLDAFPLFTEPFELAFSRNHRFFGRHEIGLADILNERIIRLAQCEMSGELARRLDAAEVRVHEVTTDSDVMALLEANLGVAIIPASAARSETVCRLPLGPLAEMRTVSVYSVAGRRRSSAGAALFNLLRAADWAPDQTIVRVARAS